MNKKEEYLMLLEMEEEKMLKALIVATQIFTSEELTKIADKLKQNPNLKKQVLTYL